MRIRPMLALGALLISTIALAPGTTAAQEADEFTISPTSGVPGDVVSTQLDPAAIERECIGIDDLPDLLGGVNTQFLEATGSLPADQNLARVYFTLTLNVIGDPDAVIDDQPAGELFLEQTSVLTFARIADQAEVGERSNFDRTTGAGEITVPAELTPGLWGLAATCAEPNVTPETAAAALAAGTAALAQGQEDELPAEDLVALVGQTILEGVMGQGPVWFAQFTVPRALPEADPQVEAFCAAIPALLPVGNDLIEALGNLPEDPGEPGEDNPDGITDEEWAELVDWDALNTEITDLVDAAMDLLAAGDESRPDELAETWEEAVGQLRQIYDALEAIDYDFSTPSGRLVAGQIADQLPDDITDGDGDSDDPSATEVLTEWFMENCTPDPAATATPAAAGPATPIAGSPNFTG